MSTTVENLAQFVVKCIPDGQYVDAFPFFPADNHYGYRMVFLALSVLSTKVDKTQMRIKRLINLSLASFLRQYRTPSHL